MRRKFGDQNGGRGVRKKAEGKAMGVEKGDERGPEEGMRKERMRRKKE